MRNRSSFIAGGWGGGGIGGMGGGGGGVGAGRGVLVMSQ